MRKKKITTAILAGLALGVSALGFACAKESKKADPVEISGLDVLSELTVDAGLSVKIEVPLVFDEYGNVLEVYYDVTDGSGNYVPVETGEFFATDGGGYTIHYVVKTSDNGLHTAQTKVTVNGSKTLMTTGKRVCLQGETMEIVPSSELVDPTYSYEVKYDGQSVTLDGASYACAEAGFYDVTITATDKTRTVKYSYRTYAYEKSEYYPTYGEVEIVDENWAEVKRLQGYGLHGWEAVSSAESNLKDRNGDDGYFLKTTAGAIQSNVQFWLSPVHGKSYYEALANEGYEYLSVWVYTECEKDHGVSRIMDPLGAGTTHIKGIRPYEWTEVKIPLTEGKNDWTGSFVTSYDYYKNQRCPLLSISAGEEMTVYVGDVYVTKPLALEATATELTSTVRTSLDLRSYLLGASEMDLDFYATFRGETQKLASPEYRYTANGEYSFTAIPVRRDTSGSAQFTVEVTDDVRFKNGGSSVLERTDGALNVSLADLSLAFESKTDETLQITLDETRLQAYYYAEKLTATGGSFEASRDGLYVVECVGTYVVDGVTYTTYRDYTIDVYSAETMFSFFTLDNYAATKYWSYHPVPTVEQGEYTVGGVTDKMLKVATGETFVVSAHPTFSKAYYEKLLDDYPDLVSSIEFYVDGSIPDGFAALKYSNLGKVENKWVTSDITIAEYLGAYDKFAQGYYDALAVTSAQPAKEYNRNAKNYIVCAWGAAKNTTLYFREVCCKSFEDVTQYLVDVKGLTNYDLTSEKSMTKSNADYLKRNTALEYALTGRDGTVIDLGKTATVALDGVKNGFYTLTATDTDGTVVYTGYVDFYDSNDVFVWSEGAAISDVWKKQGAASVNVSVVKDPKGATGDYYKIEALGSFAVVFYPAHGKRYYENYRGKGIVVSFNYYVEADGARNVTFMGDTAGVNRTPNAWNTKEMKLDDLLDSWDSLFVNQSVGWPTAGAMLKYHNSAELGSVYVGGFTSKLVIGTAISDATDHLVDVKGLTTYDLKTHITADMSAFANQTLVWKLTPYFGGNTVTLGGSTVTLSEVEKRLYKVTANVTLDGMEAAAYAGTVDFYDSTEALVWNDGKDLKLLSTTANGEVKTVTNPQGATGNFYQISHEFSSTVSSGRNNEGFKVMALPLHGAAYYTKLASGYTLKYDVYLTGTDTSGNALTYLYRDAASPYNNSDGWSYFWNTYNTNKWYTGAKCGSVSDWTAYGWEAVASKYLLRVDSFLNGVIGTKTCSVYAGNFRLEATV